MNKFAALMSYIRENMCETELGLNSMLAYIHQETASGSPVNTTKLVRKLCFGTGPTVAKKVTELEYRGLIDVSQSGSDLRAKTITVTKQGVQYLSNSERRRCLTMRLNKAQREAVRAKYNGRCAYCDNPLFAGTKCKNCGRVTLAEQDHIAASGKLMPNHIADADKMVVPEGYALISIDALKAWGKYDEVRSACRFPVEPVKQEPVAVVEITYGREPECYVTGNIDDFPEGVFKLYAAPVRTKDLTDTPENGELERLHGYID